MQGDAPASALLHHQAGDVAVLRFVPTEVFSAGVVGVVEVGSDGAVQPERFGHELSVDR